MKKIFSLAALLAALAIWVSSAQAVIKIEVAEVQNGVAFIKGNGAVKAAQITWEGFAVTTANNKNGGFSFMSVLPDDCTGVLSDGNQNVNVAVLHCTPAAPAPVPQTGQTPTVPFAAPAGSDGALEKGVAWPNPRFTVNVNAANDNGVGGGIANNGICDGTETCNGTVTDNLTGLIWLKNANCPEDTRDWQTALGDVVSLNTSGTMNGNNCGDTSNAGSHQTDWRLPNIRELQSLVDYGFAGPARSNVAGTGKAGDPDDPFTSFQSSGYWSSTTEAFSAGNAWYVGFNYGNVNVVGKAGSNDHVLAVRGGS